MALRKHFRFPFDVLSVHLAFNKLPRGATRGKLGGHDQ
jgi:hypothetical protein